jgi:hypothetical protein
VLDSGSKPVARKLAHDHVESFENGAAVIGHAISQQQERT